MSVLHKIISLVRSELFQFPRVTKAIIAFIFCRKETIIMRGHFRRLGRSDHDNWGDDINDFFLSAASGKKVILYPDTFLSRILNLPNFLCIGSTITFFSLKNTTVWGSGLINDVITERLKIKPKKILAVRGPLTREWLLNQGIDCPKVYGDPALLLPRLYEAHPVKKHKIGLIPHYIDICNPIVKKLLEDENVQLIKVREYDKWTDLIDKINECDFVISSSLHGLVVSEAYDIPAIWAEFEGTNYLQGWEFKFLDFYASIGKKDAEFLKIEANTNINDLRNIAMKWQPGNIDTDELLKVCPFKLHPIN